jgi:hypothetical protein
MCSALPCTALKARSARLMRACSSRCGENSSPTSCVKRWRNWNSRWPLPQPMSSTDVPEPAWARMASARLRGQPERRQVGEHLARQRGLVELVVALGKAHGSASCRLGGALLRIAAAGQPARCSASASWYSSHSRRWLWRRSSAGGGARAPAHPAAAAPRGRRRPAAAGRPAPAAAQGRTASRCGPCATSSGKAPTRLAMTGRPQAKASTSVRGKTSAHTLGSTSAVARLHLLPHLGRRQCTQQMQALGRPPVDRVPARRRPRGWVRHARPQRGRGGQQCGALFGRQPADEQQAAAFTRCGLARAGRRSSASGAASPPAAAAFEQFGAVAVQRDVQRDVVLPGATQAVALQHQRQTAEAAIEPR